MPADPYATRSFDDAFEPLCTAPDELPTSVMRGRNERNSTDMLIDMCIEITRTAATTLPPALPETV